ncbi:hypothetical protein D9M70_503270 [compost metagenome]
MHAADRPVEILQLPRFPLIERNANGSGVMAAVPFLTRALNAPEDWQQPGSVIAHHQRRANETATGEVEIATFGSDKYQGVGRVPAELGHPDPALILIAGGLGGVKEPKPAVGSGEEDRVLFRMRRVEAQALRRPPCRRVLRQHRGKYRNIGLAFKRASEPGAGERTI